MKKISILIFLVIIAFAFMFINWIGNRDVAGNKASGPNIILITMNVFRADHVSYNGYFRQTTPAIDKIAEDSYVFSRAFAHVGYTMPNMMSMFTSLYPDSHQVYDAYKDEVSSKIRTLAEILQLHGYKTAWFAKHDMPHLSPQAGFSRGFSYISDLGLNFERKEAIFKWLRDNRDEPFFLAMNVRHTHTPYIPIPKYYREFSAGLKDLAIENEKDFEAVVDEKFLRELRDPQSNLFSCDKTGVIAAGCRAFREGRLPRWLAKSFLMLFVPTMRESLGGLEVSSYYDAINLENEDNLKSLIAHYDASILGVDQEIVRPIYELLQNENIYDNTLIIVTADHGESLGEHGIFGHGLQAFEQLIRIPFVLKMPKQRGKREDISSLVQTIDIMPTILDISGILVPHTAQGKSLLPLLKNTDMVLNEYVFGENHNSAYIRSEKWKVFYNWQKDKKGERSENAVLFDLFNDPAELQDVKGSHLDVYHEMKEKLDKHLKNLPRYVDREFSFEPRIDAKTRKRIKETGYW